MVSTLTVPQNLVADTWVETRWDAFVVLAEQAEFEKAWFYYDQGCMRVEMAAVGPLHARDNAIVSKVVSLYATLNNIPLMEYMNCSFRKAEIRECQPDISFYIGLGVQFPQSSSAPVDLNTFEPPTLVIEIASSSLNEDLGRKRLLYEQLGASEYWVVDTVSSQVFAFDIVEGRSGRIQASRVLPGLAISLVEEALKRGQTEDDGALNRWLLQTVSPS